jgi:hypothetical protein
MKKLITALAIVAAMFVAGKAQAQFSVNFGLSQDFITERISTGGTPTGDAPSISINSLHSSGCRGLSLGANYNFQISEDFGIAIGGQFRWNHSNISETIFGPLPQRYISNVFYVDVPVTLNYSFSIGNNWKISPVVGPMLTYGIGGKLKICDQDYNNPIVHPWYGEYGDSYYTNHDYKHFDLSAVGGVNFSYKQFNLYGGYRYGLLDIDKDDVAKTHTSGVLLGLGYTF